jgi:PncC family amidohydrolase
MGNYEIELGKMLINSKLTLSVAESLTGGLLSKRITDVSGSSAYFLGGVVVYSSFAKENILNVSKDLMDLYGTVSGVVAEALAKNVKKIFGSHVSIATTGIAGPTEIENKPVGLVFVGVVVNENIFIFTEHFEGSRETIREKTVDFALDKTISILKQGG